jgi:drug/metabolite transporter (DMT)-like permease
MSRYKNYIGLHFLLFVFSFSAVFSKLASEAQFLSFEFAFFYGIMLFFLMIYAFFWQKILKAMPLTTAYANRSVVMIWIMLWGLVFFEEKISVGMILGAAIVLVGISLVVSADE